MRKFAFVTIVFLWACAPGEQAENQSETQRYLYLSTPDAAQVEGQAEGAGILIFDIDDGHKLVRRIDIPEFEEGTRGPPADRSFRSGNGGDHLGAELHVGQ